jgi:hypothetical protein
MKPGTTPADLHRESDATAHPARRPCCHRPGPTVFNITKEAVIARQAAIDPFAWPVTGPTKQTGPPMSQPHPPPPWWASALITD